MRLKEYTAIRRVSRLDYLFVVLEHAQIGYERENALRDIQKIQTDLEADKAKALGKQKPRSASGGAVLTETEKMALQLHFVARTMGGIRLTSDGELLLSAMKGQTPVRLSDTARAIIIARFWQIYPKFGETIFAIIKQTNGTMELPMPTDINFRDAAEKRYGLDCDALSFKIIRELGSELGLLNWHIIEDGKKRLQRIYALTCIKELDSLRAANRQLLDGNDFSERCVARLLGRISSALDKEEFEEIEAGFGKIVTIEGHGNFIIFAAHDERFIVVPCQELMIEKFEEQLWQTYLELVNYRSLYPVIYPKLRNEVCFCLHISDEHFDELVKELIKAPRRIKVFPSTGILDYSRDFAHLHKHLPPQNEDGQFITFLKLGKVK